MHPMERIHITKKSIFIWIFPSTAKKENGNVILIKVI